MLAAIKAVSSIVTVHSNAVVTACPTLNRIEEEEGEWIIENPGDCLELLLELQAVEDSVVLEWPEGEKLRIKHQADLKDFRLAVIAVW